MTELMYKGTVCITARHKKYRYNNAGSTKLFNLLINFLCGAYVNSFDKSVLPGKIGIFKMSKDDLLNSSPNSKQISNLKDRTTIDCGTEADTTPYVQYNFIIEARDIIDKNIQTTAPISLGLISANKQDVLAAIDLADIEGENNTSIIKEVLAGNTSVVINWKLCFVNSTSNKEGAE